jgi:hypothetical protein
MAARERMTNATLNRVSVDLFFAMIHFTLGRDDGSFITFSFNTLLEEFDL